MSDRGPLGRRVARGLVAGNGLAWTALGAWGTLWSAEFRLLPADTVFLGLPPGSTGAAFDRPGGLVAQEVLCRTNAGLGIALVAIGLTYTWLAFGPMRRGETWSSWAFLASGLIALGGWLSSHHDGLGVPAGVALVVLFAAALVASLPHLGGLQGIGSLYVSGARAWLWSPAGLGRAYMALALMALIAAGFAAMVSGLIAGPTIAQWHIREPIADIHPGLGSLLGYSHATFGALLCAAGVVELFSLLCGAQPAARGVWRALLVSGVVSFASAGVVASVSVWAVIPVALCAALYFLGLATLRRPVYRADAPAPVFPELGP